MHFGRHLLCLTSVAAAIVTAANAPQALDNLRQTPVVRAVHNARPSVVNIHGRKMLRDNANQSESYRPVNGMGTGVVVDERGYILTNYHVVEGVARIKVTLADGRTMLARLVNHDPKTDLAIIKIDSTDPLPVMPIGTSSDLMEGETVIAMGNAYGYPHTVTVGIISALHRPVPVTEEQRYSDLIQTDASINPGNSGGPLLNIFGDMIGINVAVRVGAQGIGFALPIDEAMGVVARLLSVERINGLAHGVQGRTVWKNDASSFVVEQVSGERPDGVAKGDVVLEVDGLAIRRGLDFERALIARSASEEIPVKVDRNGHTETVYLSLSRGAATSPTTTASISQRVWEELGIKVNPVSPQDEPLASSPYEGGMRVTEVRAGSPADRERIKPGDILVGIHRWATGSLRDLGYILNSSEFSGNQPAQFFVLRGTDVLYGYLTVTPQPQRLH